MGLVSLPDVKYRQYGGGFGDTLLKTAEHSPSQRRLDSRPLSHSRIESSNLRYQCSRYNLTATRQGAQTKEHLGLIWAGLLTVWRPEAMQGRQDYRPF